MVDNSPCSIESYEQMNTGEDNPVEAINISSDLQFQPFTYGPAKEQVILSSL